MSGVVGHFFLTFWGCPFPGIRTFSKWLRFLLLKTTHKIGALKNDTPTGRGFWAGFVELGPSISFVFHFPRFFRILIVRFGFAQRWDPTKAPIQPSRGKLIVCPTSYVLVRLPFGPFVGINSTPGSKSTGRSSDESFVAVQGPKGVIPWMVAKSPLHRSETRVSDDPADANKRYVSFQSADVFRPSTVGVMRPWMGFPGNNYLVFEGTPQACGVRAKGSFEGRF